jgi:hypothetical protein
MPVKLKVRVQWEEEDGKKLSVNSSTETPMEAVSSSLAKLFREIESGVKIREANGK